ncbi:MAG: hypothetical protein R3293_22675 [Candidatus Promineifilaceae bacterium]|nr:hypothetical protein [Candidatus Promineifilaceae bacterium]
MATRLKVTPPDANTPLSGDWIRLGRPASTFDVVADFLAQGDLGRIQPLYPGPSDKTILPVGPDIADPDGSTSDNFLTLFVNLFKEIPPS